MACRGCPGTLNNPWRSSREAKKIDNQFGIGRILIEQPVEPAVEGRMRGRTWISGEHEMLCNPYGFESVEYPKVSVIPRIDNPERRCG